MRNTSHTKCLRAEATELENHFTFESVHEFIQCSVEKKLFLNQQQKFQNECKQYSESRTKKLNDFK